MNPVISARRFFESEDIINGYHGLTCWLLYSDMHKALWQYVRENWHAIDEMSDRSCLICVIDKPSTWEDPFWQDANIKPDFSDLLKSKPFNRNEHLGVVRTLGLDYADIPAFVFFPSVQSHEKLVVKIDRYATYNDLTDTFSRVMDCVRKAVKDSRFQDPDATTFDPIEEREQCQHRLEPLINRMKVAAVVRRVITPTNILNAVQSAVF